MDNKFRNNFFETRDETLINIKSNSYNWNKFINYWSKILDKYSIDNIINLYYYNHSGRVFYTFEEWNSEKINRRIKPKSKGIPILINDKKTYVFEIRQTYGRDYKVWNYNHFINETILKYYQTQINLNNNDNKSLYENFYDIFYKMSQNQITDNYITMDANELEFVAKTMTSLFLAKCNFNINIFSNSYDLLDSMDIDNILKCMQIANKETAILYNDFKEKAMSLEDVQNFIRTNILFNLKNNEMLGEDEKKQFLSSIENNIHFNYEILDKIYNYYTNKYKLPLKKKIDKIENNEEIVSNTFSSQTNTQLSLFVPREEELANKICDIFNSFDTKYQNTFEVADVELQVWEHISSKKRNLSILLKSPIADYGENAFSYFNSDKTDEEKINDGIKNNFFLQQLYKDKDFSISMSPDLIHIFWHNFDDKQFDLNISSTKIIDKEEIDNQELEKIDNKTDFIAKETELIPISNVIETNTISENTFPINIDKADKEDKYPKINYHISDEKVDNSFGAKSRFDNNIASIKLLKQLELENRNATKDEQEILAKYVGWGGIADAFDESKTNWNNEYKELKNLLSDEEYKEARQSTLTSFYTPNVFINH